MEEKNYYVYKHTFPNNKVYIGITQQEPEKRWKNGLGYDAHQTLMKRAIKKYGWQNIKHEILYKNLNKNEACNKEIELIALYDSTNKQKGYNVSQGGEGTIGVKPTEESKEKNRIAHLGKKASLETRKKISESNKGKHNKKRTKEQKKKISEATKKAMQNPILRKRLSETHSGKNHRNYGKHLSDETKKKISESSKGKKGGFSKKVICIETNKIYESISLASKDTKADRYGIGQVCLGKRKSAGKYNGQKLHWKYIKEE